MPPICYHLALASEAARRLASPFLDRNLGNYLLGSTIPDSHIVTRSSRRETHFFDLDNPGPQSGVEALFRACPEVSAGSEMDEDSRALVAGYMCHLLADEAWIRSIYQPFFARGAPWGGDPLAGIWDRAVQYRLDQRIRSDRHSMAGIRSHLAQARLPQHPKLLARASLKEWRRFVEAAIEREPTWEGFASFAHKYLLPRLQVGRERLDEFLTSLPQGLETIMQRIGEGCLEAFREEAVAQSIAATRRYLDAHRQG